MFMGIILCIFSASGLNLVYRYLQTLKFNWVKNVFLALILILFVFTSFIPSYTSAIENNEIANSKIKEMKWIDINTDFNSTVLGNVNEGNLIASIGKRKNVVDSNFIFAPNPVERVNDIQIIYSTVSEAVAKQLISKYDIDIIYVSDQTRDLYDIQNLTYAENSACFESVRGGTYYVVKC